MAPQAGVLTQVLAHEGYEVRAGDALAALSSERRSEALGETEGEALRARRARRDSLIEERDRHRALFARQAAAQESRLAVMAAEATDLDEEFELQRARFAMSEAATERQRELRARDLGTETTFRAADEDALDQAIALQTLERQRTTLARARLEIEAPLREELQLAEISRAVATLDQELAEAEAQRESVIAAPQAGVVTGMRRSLGHLLLLAFVIEIFALLAPLFLSLTVDQAIVSADRDLLLTLAVAFGLLLVLQTAVSALRGWMLITLGASLKVQARTNLFSHLIALPADFSIPAMSPT